MFGKKKKQQEMPKIPVSYQYWTEDFGFLLLVLERKKAMAKYYLIDVYRDQLPDRTNIKSADINSIITDCVSDTINTISDNYKNFLISKYFKSEEALINFIVDDTFNDLTTATIKGNFEKIQKDIIQKNIETVRQKNQHK